MKPIPGGSFRMGSERHYPEEAPCRTVTVAAFLMDETPVTNAEFARFVDATGYRTLAERMPAAADYPDASAARLRPGSAVFQKTDGPVSLADPSIWWIYTFGAAWRHPTGDAALPARADHPVVHVAYADALAFAAWAGKALPTEAEWERAARGGLDGAEYAWGDEFSPAGEAMANVWSGRFPWECIKRPGCDRTTPVRRYTANAYGLYDLIGNVWEWTTNTFDTQPGETSCCHVQVPSDRAPRRVIKGGSHLCAENHCRRYRPAARQGQTEDGATSHIGFRCVVRAAAR